MKGEFLLVVSHIFNRNLREIIYRYIKVALIHFFMRQINLAHPKKYKNGPSYFCHFFENFDSNFQTLGTGKAKTQLQIQTHHF